MVKKELSLKVLPEGHIRLFRREILDLMIDQDINLLSTFISSSIVEKIKKLYISNEEMAKIIAFNKIAFLNDNSGNQFLIRILMRSENSFLPGQFYLKGLKTYDYYLKLFSKKDPFKIDKIVDVIEPDPIVQFLKRKKSCEEYDKLFERVHLYLQKKQIYEAACELIRNLPYCSDHINSKFTEGKWYYDFLEACLSHGYTHFLPQFIDQNYKIELENYRMIQENKLKKEIVLNDEIITMDDYPSQPRSQENFVQYRVVSSEIVYKSAEYYLRPYQNELVVHAKKGRNTIICAPTGCGKTLVATDIILNHLRTLRLEGKVGRALMLVPTVPLVDQQTLEFVRYMAGEFWVDGFSGAESLNNRAGNFLASNVCVATPQIIINMLNSILKKEKIYLSDITLVIFDECHNCSGDHPYKILMEMVEKAPIVKKPQIIGLTASLGVGQTSWDINACREHMLKMCSNLTADSISTVRHQLENLRLHVMPPVDIVIRARRPINDKFSQCIKEAMTSIQLSMMPLLEEVVNKQLVILKKEETEFPDHKYSARYQNVVGFLRKSLQRLTDSTKRLILIRSIDHLSHYFHAISISDLLPNKFALMYLDSKMATYAISRNKNDINYILSNLYDSTRKKLQYIITKKQEENKEILQKLYLILRDQYLEKPESRTLIFVATRACAQRLSEHLSEYLTQCNNLRAFYKRPNIAAYMTSTNQSAGASGQSNEMQRIVREKFKRGEIKILVVTSVADEGINIMECNLIVKYNTVGSERTLIQRRGRARAKDSKAILLALDGSVELQEFENMKKETMMLECINDLQSHRDETLQAMIAKKTMQITQMKEQKMKNLQEQYDLLNNRRYLLKCRACSAKICDSTKIRCIPKSLYVCCDTEIWQRSSNEIIKKPSKDGIITKCAQWVCKQCKEIWGVTICYSTVFFPSLSIKSCEMERIDTKEVTSSVNAKNWTQIQKEFFNIDLISTQNIREMYYALINNAENDQHKKLEHQEQIANQLALEKQTERKIKRKILLDE